MARSRLEAKVTGSAYAPLIDRITKQLEVSAKVADECRDLLRPSLIWTANHLQPGRPEVCGDLVKGGYGAAIEAVSLLSFGLVRPAILSLRAHYELSLQFLYYKDHPIEWRNVATYRSQPSLPGANKKYLRDCFPQYEKRINKLAKASETDIEDCYEVLSGIAHGTALDSISSALRPQDLVEDAEVVTSAKRVFHAVGETIFDIHLSAYESNWVSLPPLAKEILERRFKSKNPREELDL